MPAARNTSSISLTWLVGVLAAGWASYAVGNPLAWILVHALLNWFYLLYLCAGCGGGLPDGLFSS